MLYIALVSIVRWKYNRNFSEACMLLFEDSSINAITIIEYSMFACLN